MNEEQLLALMTTILYVRRQEAGIRNAVLVAWDILLTVRNMEVERRGKLA